MSKKFPYGYDVNTYIEKALEKAKFTYPWATKEMFDPDRKYAIEKIGNRYQYVTYLVWSETHIDRDVRKECKTGEDFIDVIISQNSSNIERENPTKEIFEISYERGVEIHGWYLEKYEFHSHVLGGYSSYVQAGNRSTGGSREFFIPPSYFEKDFDTFLNQYEELVPGYHFGLEKEDLKKVKGLKEFLGFKDK